MKLISLIVLSVSASACLAASDKPRNRRVKGPVWNGECRSWGTMREVMHEGKKQARVSLANATRPGRIYGVGALAELAGEIFIEDGDVWVSRVVGPNQQKTVKISAEEAETHSATLLVVASVPGSQPVSIERDVPFSELEVFLAEQIAKAGFDITKPTPVLMIGPFAEVQGHIANGHCPSALGKDEGGALPEFAVSYPEVWGRVVGFYAEGQEGVLTHHASKVHLHFLSDNEPRLMVHADKLGLKKGSVLFLPVRERQHPVIPQKGN